MVEDKRDGGRMTAETITKPPFRYYGGKQRYVLKILPWLPPHLRYVEPFCGSAAVMFAKGVLFKGRIEGFDYQEVVNDVNGDVVNFFRVCQDADLFEKLSRKLEFTLYARDEHRRAGELLKAPLESIDNVDRAWAFVTKTKTSFGGLLRGVFGISTLNEPRKASLGLPKEYFDRIKKVHVEKLDAIECIKKWDCPQALFYCDPPYVGTRQEHYKGYEQTDFERLLACLGNIKGSFVLSTYDNPAVPRDWEKFEFKATASIANRGKSGNSSVDLSRTECVFRKLSPWAQEQIAKNHQPKIETAADELPLFQAVGI
jgi:DNA adenine methylase